MTRYITPAMRQRDEIAWRALVAGANASQAAEQEARKARLAAGQCRFCGVSSALATCDQCVEDAGWRDPD